MSEGSFVHLRLHSAYSLAEGALRIKELVKVCAAQGMPALAVTDTGNMFGALEFSFAAKDAGLQPIIGCVLTLCHDDLPEGRSERERRQRFSRMVLLAQNTDGYANLRRLVSSAFLDTAPPQDPHLPFAKLAGLTDGLIALTGGLDGPIPSALAMSRPDLAESRLDALQALFPGRLYMELQRHGLPEQDRIEPALIDLAYARDIPLVATNDAYFLKPDMHAAHDALLCIADGRYITEADRRRVSPENWFKPPEAMRALFADLPEAADNTLVVAQRCAFMLEFVAPILPPFPCEDGRDEAAEMRHQATEGLKRRLERHVYTEAMDEAGRAAVAEPYFDRLAFELKIIEGMKFPGYFLIVSDFIKWAKANGVPVGPGRGSGAASVVAWSLQITDLDPLRFDLLFERFLNPERVSMPDFDIDFCQETRDRVIGYVQQKYGEDRVAQIITFGKLQARAVLRDVGRVLQMPFGQVDRLCKLVPNNPANPVTLAQALEKEPQLQEAQKSDETVARLIDIALKLEGLYRHASTHAAGVVIGDRPLVELVPLYRDPRSTMPVTQFNMKFVEQAGLIKFDFLGLKTLDVLQKTVDLLADRDIAIDLAALPLDDEKTYKMLARAETVGVFQLESSGMRDVLRKLKPDRFEDIVALVALYRPGPMDNIPKYIAVKNGEIAPDYLHPKLKPILEETNGIMIYQEQVMTAAQVLSGYTLGGADLLRRAMGKKIKEEMDKQRRIFVDGAVANGVDGDQASNIFDIVAKFADYGFNKAHAAAYALVAYQTAYLKANYPVEFMAALMTLDLSQTDKLSVFRQELQRIDVPLLGPDINRSVAEFSVETTRIDGQPRQAIRYALGAIKGVGVAAMQAIVREREAAGPYGDIFALTSRVDLHAINKRQLEQLTTAGAFDGIHANRAQLHGVLEAALRYGAALAEERASGQIGLFGGGSGTALQTPRLPAVADWDSLARLNREAQAIGFCLSAHPLDEFAAALRRLKVVPFAELPARMRSAASSRFQLAGVVMARQERISKSGNRFAFLRMSDASGEYEVMLFSEILAVNRAILEVNTPLLIHVDAQGSGEELRLSGQRIELLEQAVLRGAEALEIHLADESGVAALQTLLAKVERGRMRIAVKVPLPDNERALVTLPDGFAFSAEQRRSLRNLPGIADVVDL